MVEIYNPYKKYGLRRVVNAATCLTRLGGSIPHPEVFEAMEDASKSFVQIPELQAWAGRKIAEATGAEAGLPTAGANNALMLASAACIMKGTELEEYNPLETETWTKIIMRLPAHTEGLRTEFIVQKNDRNNYDHAVECAGGRLVEAGTMKGTMEEELDEAFDPERTATYYYTVRSAKHSLPLRTVVKVAHSHGVPVIVDAAAELPPRRKLTQYIEEGADLVIFSGGKHIGGPNNSGILAGKRDLVKLAHLQAYPFHGVGRASKMSRETIVGLVRALELYLEKDEEAHYHRWKEEAKHIADQLMDIPGVETGITYQKTVEEDSPTTPLCYLELDEEAVGTSGRELVNELRKGNPSIETLYEPSFLLEKYERKVTINPQYMLEGDTEIVVDRIREILTKRSPLVS
jgi:L-seryl-tRNA(Ser) seleniumtransferase